MTRLSEEQLRSLVLRSYDIARTHGFHDKELSKEHMLMLVISEIGEAIEADRKGNHADIVAFMEREHVHPDYRERFKAYIKDSVEDELSDVCIRLFDLCGTLGVDVEIPSDRDANVSSYMSQLSFCERCFYLCRILTNPFDKIGERLGDALYAILWMCDDMGIDIVRHIELKMEYNSVREVKHGKAY